jgi:hypothetical protein
MPQHASICPTATACGVSPSLLRQLSSPSPIGSSLVEIRELLTPLSLMKDCDRPFVSQHVDEVRQLRVVVVKGVVIWGNLGCRWEISRRILDKPNGACLDLPHP